MANFIIILTTLLVVGTIFIMLDRLKKLRQSYAPRFACIEKKKGRDRDSALYLLEESYARDRSRIRNWVVFVSLIVSSIGYSLGSFVLHQPQSGNVQTVAAVENVSADKEVMALQEVVDRQKREFIQLKEVIEAQQKEINSQQNEIAKFESQVNSEPDSKNARVIIILTTLLVVGIFSIALYRLKKLRQSYAPDANIGKTETDRIVNAYQMSENYVRQRSRIVILAIAAAGVVALIGLSIPPYLRYQHLRQNKVQEVATAKKYSADKKVAEIKKVSANKEVMALKEVIDRQSREFAQLKEVVDTQKKKIASLNEAMDCLKEENVSLKKQPASKSFFSDFDVAEKTFFIMFLTLFVGLFILGLVVMHFERKR